MEQNCPLHSLDEYQRGIPGFTGTTLVDLQLPCTFDFTVASTKYFHALEAGEIPLCVMFSGTVFYRGENVTANRADAVGS